MIEYIWYGLAVVAAIPVITCAFFTAMAFKEYIHSMEIIKAIRLKLITKP